MTRNASVKAGTVGHAAGALADRTLCAPLPPHRWCLRADERRLTTPCPGLLALTARAPVDSPSLLAQVIRCALENAASVAKTFLTSDVVVTEIKGA